MRPLETYTLSPKLTVYSAQKLPELIQFLNQQILELARQTMASNSSFSIALAGGKTPQLLFQELAQNSSSWEGWQIFFSDERLVPPEHPDSNFGTAYRLWLQQIPESCYFRFHGEAKDSALEAKRYETAIEKRVPRQTGHLFPSFDLILLGMGNDGHTASLFPETNALQEEKRGVVVNQTPYGPRFTFTFPLINHAKQVWILVTGAEKSDCLHDVFQTDSAPQYPVQKVNPFTGQLCWFIDEKAAQKIQWKKM